MGKSNNLDDFLTDLANTIREKKGTNEPINAQDFSSEIASIQSGGDIWGFDTIGYTPQNSPIKEWVEYSKYKASSFTPSLAPNYFKNDTNIVLAPYLDLSKCSSLSNMFNGCIRLLAIADYDTQNAQDMNYLFYGCSAIANISINTSNATTLQHTFQGCTSLVDIELDLSSAKNVYHLFPNCSNLIECIISNSGNVENFGYSFSNNKKLKKVQFLDFNSVTSITNTFSSCSALAYLAITNLGKSTLTTYDFSGASVWGTGGEENRQSLIDSLITYSYDRASNGMSTATIQLSANTKALLTDDEIAQITAKGFTIA